MTVEPLNQRSDEALMSRVAVGDTTGLAVLVARYRSRVFAVLFRATGGSHETEDLFQETWIRVAQRAVRFDPARRFGPWIARIAMHIAIDWMRSARGRATISGSWQDRETDNVASGDNTPIQSIEERAP